MHCSLVFLDVSKILQSNRPRSSCTATTGRHIADKLEYSDLNTSQPITCKCRDIVIAKMYNWSFSIPSLHRLQLVSHREQYVNLKNWWRPDFINIRSSPNALSFPILTTNGWWQEILLQTPNMGFHKNPSGSGTVPCRRTDMRLIIAFSNNFTSAPKKKLALSFQPH